MQYLHAESLAQTHAMSDNTPLAGRLLLPDLGQTADDALPHEPQDLALVE